MQIFHVRCPKYDANFAISFTWCLASKTCKRVVIAAIINYVLRFSPIKQIVMNFNNFFLLLNIFISINLFLRLCIERIMARQRVMRDRCMYTLAGECFRCIASKLFFDNFNRNNNKNHEISTMLWGEVRIFVSIHQRFNIIFCIKNLQKMLVIFFLFFPGWHCV